MLFDFKNNVESRYNLGLFLKGGNSSVAEGYFQNSISVLCQDLGLAVFQLQELPFEYMFTDVEFNKKLPDENEESFINKHFYTKLFRELKKKKVLDEAKGKEFWTWEYRPKFCFTLDRSLTPEASSSSVQYGSLNLGSMPVLYYVLVDLQAIINLIKSV